MWGTYATPLAAPPFFYFLLAVAVVDHTSNGWTTSHGFFLPPVSRRTYHQDRRSPTRRGETGSSSEGGGSLCAIKSSWFHHVDQSKWLEEDAVITPQVSFEHHDGEPDDLFSSSGSLVTAAPISSPTINGQAVTTNTAKASGEKRGKVRWKKKPIRTTQVHKHLYRYYPDISVDCWLRTVNATQFFRSCNYTDLDMSRIERECDSGLESLDVHRDLAPKVRFLVRTLGGGRGDIGSGVMSTEECDIEHDEYEFCPHNLAVSDAGKVGVPPSFFLGRYRLEQSVAPRHAFLVYNGDRLPHGRVLLEGDGALLEEFLRLCDASVEDFSKLCRRWSIDRSGDDDGLGVTKLEAFERAFHSGLLAAARNDITDDLSLLGLTPGQMVQLLVDHGANPIETDSHGVPLLHWAAGTGNWEGTRALIQCLKSTAGEGENPVMDARASKDGATALHWASCGVGGNFFGSGGHAKLVKLLIDEADCDSKGNLVNAKTVTGNTPLMWAAWSNSMDVAKVLVSNGAHLGKANDNGCSVAHFAAAGASLEFCRYLQQKLGVDFAQENERKRRPLDYALASGNAAVAEWISGV